ncbi:MAG: NADH-quinone oxidoreductase subunit M [Verrucomicrobia bacterium]|nr:NADH-quinone oxidoreductase subunit M [Verrucomicrobiota bacterium]
MNNYSILLLSTILVPLIVAVVLLGFSKLPKGITQFLATLGFCFPALGALILWINFHPVDATGYDYLMSLPTGLEGLGITLHLGLNGISAPLYFLAGIVGLAAGIYAMQSGAERLQQYLMLILFMQAGLMGVFASVDVFFFYFFHELALIPTFICIGVWGGRDRQSAAMEMTIYLTLGAMLSLLGLLAIYFQTDAEAFNMIALKKAVATSPIGGESQNIIFGLLLFGFGILVSLFPFHSWAPRGYAAAPTSIAMLHAGVLKKFGLYGFIQVALPLVPLGAYHWSSFLAWMALGSVLIIGLITIAQRDLKMMVGFSSVMHMGYCFLGIACLSVLGAAGVIITMVAHGLTVALLFLLGHVVYRRTDTYDMDDMGGLVKQTPALAAIFSAAVLASIGLPGPGLLNFFGEFTVFTALWDFSRTFTAIAVLGMIISAIYGLRAIGRIFFGSSSKALEAHLKENSIKDISTAEKIPALILLVTLVVIGLWPRLMTDDLHRTLDANFKTIDAKLAQLSVEVDEPVLEVALSSEPVIE